MLGDIVQPSCHFLLSLHQRALQSEVFVFFRLNKLALCFLLRQNLAIQKTWWAVQVAFAKLFLLSHRPLTCCVNMRNLFPFLIFLRKSYSSCNEKCLYSYVPSQVSVFQLLGELEFDPRGHSAMFGDILVITTWEGGCSWQLVGRGQSRDRAKHPSVQRTKNSSTEQRTIWLKRATMLQLRNPVLAPKKRKKVPIISVSLPPSYSPSLPRFTWSSPLTGSEKSYLSEYGTTIEAH